MMWLLLTAAILTDVSAALCCASPPKKKSIWYAAVGAGHLLAFTLLSLTLEQGISLGVAYGTWAAVGVALTAVASRNFFKEHLTPVMVVGLASSLPVSCSLNCARPTRRTLEDGPESRNKGQKTGGGASRAC